MAYPKLISVEEILRAAVPLVEQGSPDGLSLRALAAALEVKAPSLYRYFPNKEALQVAVSEEIWKLLLGVLKPAAAVVDPEERFRKTALAYLRFARERFPLYTFVLQNGLSTTYGSKASKAVWNVLIDAVSRVSGTSNDTAGAVAAWAFLHGYASLEHAGAFGPSGARGGLERGMEAFVKSFRMDAEGAGDGGPRGTVRMKRERQRSRS